MINATSLGHINIVVDDIDASIEYYKKLFNCIPQQIFRNFKNKGFAKSAGFIDDSEKVNVSICFLQIPNTSIFLELMDYHYPEGIKNNKDKKTNTINGVGHICLKVNNIDASFEHVKKTYETKLITEDPAYKPYKIDPITPSDFNFFDTVMEKSKEEKEKVCKIIKNIRYFYFIDKYGIQWELEQGHDDIG